MGRNPQPGLTLAPRLPCRLLIAGVDGKVSHLTGVRLDLEDCEKVLFPYEKFLALGAIFTLMTAGTAHMEPSRGPVAVELFTSQNCYSCPPAEEYLDELAKQPNLIALEFHVDYWNSLVYGSAGRWKDVHSRAGYDN